MISHGAIVPLIGGLPLGAELAFGSKPKFVLSYSPFKANDSQFLAYHNDTLPYYIIDEEKKPIVSRLSKVDVVGATCPCAGLSSLSPSASSTNKNNDWMIQSAKFVLSEVKPQVFWGENAPRLASRMGEPIVKMLRQIGDANGYTFSLYKTKSLLHGLSQVRDRSFYFFWKEREQVPLLSFFKREHERIEDTIRQSKARFDDPMSIVTNSRIPSQQPFYRYVLEEMLGGFTHQEFQQHIKHSTNPMTFLENAGIKYCDVAVWMKNNGYEKLTLRCEKIHEKLSIGQNVMRKDVEIPKDKIGAFVGHLPMMLTHPDIDRFITIREALDIMKMPEDFVLQGGTKNLNMICQSVPVSTAADMSREILKYLNGELDMMHTRFMIQDNKNQTYVQETTPATLDTFVL